jgi:hypothetical protein
MAHNQGARGSANENDADDEGGAGKVEQLTRVFLISENSCQNP